MYYISYIITCIILCISTIQAIDEAKKQNGIIITNQDSKLGIKTKIKTEHYIQKNMSLLNSSIPDEMEYFKNAYDVIFDYSYGEETYGHKAAACYIDFLHKGVWGRGSNFADSDATTPTEISLSETKFGNHSHTNGKPLVWLKEAWVQASLNALCNQKKSEKIHTIKLGWFPFELGRGIALGSAYGLNREKLGLYSYPEDKSAPGILLNGELVKNTLWYDIYYAKFEERNKSIRDTFNEVKTHLVGRKSTPWRGVGKDDELIAGRFIYKPLNAKHNKLHIEPYFFYNEASDQRVELQADTKMNFGSSGLNIEHNFHNFYWSAEATLNYGVQKMKAIDRNTIKIVRNDQGLLQEQYTHIQNNNNNSIVSRESKKAAAIDLDASFNGQQIPGYEDFISKSNRFRNSYRNRLQGYMITTDASYIIPSINVSIAAEYGYASGDSNPHKQEIDKDYQGFIGLHELYTGHKVKSIIILGERLLQTPSGIMTDEDKADKDFAYSDLQNIGYSIAWNPTLSDNRKASIESNIIHFWKAATSKKFDITTGKGSTENARRYMGTEWNISLDTELVKSMGIYAKVAFFFPGDYFIDVKGTPMGNDIFDSITQYNTIERSDISKEKLRLSNDTSYHINIGINYKF